MELHRTKLLLFVNLAILLLISIGCAAKKNENLVAYNDVFYNPELEHSVNIYFDKPMPVDVGIFSDSSCTLGKHGTRIDSKELPSAYVVEGYKPRYTTHSSMSKINVDPKDSVIVSLNLNDRNYVNGANIGTNCDFTFEFMPTLNHNYVVTYRLGDEKCFASVIDVSESSKQNKWVTAVDLKKLDLACDVYKSYPNYNYNSKNN